MSANNVLLIFHDFDCFRAYDVSVEVDYSKEKNRKKLFEQSPEFFANSLDEAIYGAQEYCKRNIVEYGYRFVNFNFNHYRYDIENLKITKNNISFNVSVKACDIKKIKFKEVAKFKINKKEGILTIKTLKNTKEFDLRNYDKMAKLIKIYIAGLKKESFFWDII